MTLSRAKFFVDSPTLFYTLNTVQVAGQCWRWSRLIVVGICSSISKKKLLIVFLIKFFWRIGRFPLTTYCKRFLNCETYKILNNLYSLLLYDLIMKKKSACETRNLLKVDPPKYRFVDYKIWNNIPMCIREKPSYNYFKSALKKVGHSRKLIFTKKKL